jgi:hypothetical protein
MSIKTILVGILALTLSACSTFKIVENSESPRTPAAIPVAYSSIGVLSSGEHINDSALLEAKLSNALYEARVRNLTASILFPGTLEKPVDNMLRVLKRENIAALLHIKNLNIEAQTYTSSNLYQVGQKTKPVDTSITAVPLYTMGAELELIDVNTKAVVWSGRVEYEDSTLLPLLLEKTAEKIVENLEQRKYLIQDKDVAPVVSTSK